MADTTIESICINNLHQKSPPYHAPLDDDRVYVITSQQCITPPSHIKEALFTQYHATTACNDTLQAIHTLFVNTTIDSVTDNRVLNDRPPPKEATLNY